MRFTLRTKVQALREAGQRRRKRKRKPRARHFLTAPLHSSRHQVFLMHMCTHAQLQNGHWKLSNVGKGTMTGTVQSKLQLSHREQNISWHRGEPPSTLPGGNTAQWESASFGYRRFLASSEIAGGKYYWIGGPANIPMGKY